MSAGPGAAAAVTVRSALITGGTSGLGLACARNLVMREGRHWNVLLLARDRSAGQRAMRSLNEAAGRAAAEFYAIDLGSLASIRELAEELKTRHLRFDALVCNAGVQFGSGDPRTRDGLDATFGINHLGHFFLVRCVASLLNADARIVIVSSSTHDSTQRTGMPPPRFLEPSLLARPELDLEGRFAQNDSVSVVQRRRYTTSKLCNLFFAYELHRRVRSGTASPDLPKSLTVNAFDPGLMPGTSLGRAFPPMQRFVWHYILPALRPVLRRAFGNVHTIAESGGALAELVDAPRLGGVSGEYFEGTRPIRSSPESYDEQRASALWSASDELVMAL